MENKTLRQCIIPIHKPSQREYAFFFASGVLVSIPFALFFSQFYSFFPSVLAIVVLAPFIEELAKVFPLFYRHGETERSYTVLGLLIGLGFGVSEFVLYVAFLNAPVFERVPGVIFHASSATIVGYGIAKQNPLPYYLIAVALHVGNNVFAFINDIFLGIGAQVIILVTVYFLAWRFYHKASPEKMVI
jgi:RsiW-degrading membrane proteinase PrsW (M82 family)